ncbi:MAG: hypothetical protein JSS93_13615 [Bacteroidetes bacterium]|nr:hypothetical protein [Bacteroidota bacterium]
MELLETQDPEKKKLIETSARHKQELEREIKDISDRGEKLLKNALIIGGALAATYFVVTQLSSSKKKKRKIVKAVAPSATEQQPEEEESPSFLSGMGDRLVNLASVFLIGLAKEKISDYLKNKTTDDSGSPEHSK